MSNPKEPQPNGPHPFSSAASGPQAEGRRSEGSATPPVRGSAGLSRSFWWWIAGGGLAIIAMTWALIQGFAWLGGESGSPADASGNSPSGASSQPPPSSGAADQDPSPDSAAKLLAELPAEDIPPVGNWLKLQRGQLRYCVAQKLRLKTLIGLVRTDVPTDVDMYNSRVADYKARCMNMANSAEEYQEVFDAVKTSRASIEKSAKDEWAATLAHGPVSAPSASNGSSAPSALDSVPSSLLKGSGAKEPSSTSSASTDRRSTSPAADASPVAKPSERAGAASDAAKAPIPPTEPPKASMPPPEVPKVAEPVKPVPPSAPVEEPAAKPPAPKPKPQPQPQKQFEWCVEGRCAKL